MKKKSAVKTKSCSCVDQVNEQLCKCGIRLASQIAIDFSTSAAGLESPLIRVEWVNGSEERRKLPTVVCAYCPFCGEKKV